MVFDAAGKLIGVAVLDIADDQIQAVHSIVNPDKLRHLDRRRQDDYSSADLWRHRPAAVTAGIVRERRMSKQEVDRAEPFLPLSWPAWGTP